MTSKIIQGLRIDRFTLVMFLATLIPAMAQHNPPDNFPDEIFKPDAILVTTESDLLRQTFWGTPGSYSITFARSTRANATARWTTITAEYELSFIITDIAARQGGDDLYVAGIRDDEEIVIERWQFNYALGNLAVRTVAQTPYTDTVVSVGSRNQTAIPTIGVSLSAFHTSVVVIGGGPFQPAPKVPVPQKTVIYQGTAGPFTAIDVDPEGRFLLMYNYGSKSIDRIMLNPLSRISRVFTLAQHPQLDQIGSMEVREFENEGRLYLLRRNTGSGGYGSTELYTILGDPDNDGVFDSVTSYNTPAYYASQYVNWDDWHLFWLIE